MLLPALRRAFLAAALLLALLALPAARAQQEQPSAQATLPPTFADVHYGPHERNVLDFWQAETKDPAPVIVFIHGGGFVAGDKSKASAGALKFFLHSGISFASISYRYSTQAPYPAPMLDGARAVQVIRSKAAEWHLDPRRLAAYGNSAGAGISLWLAFHTDLANPTGTDPIEHESTRLLCAGSMAGQCSYNPLTIREWVGGRAWQHQALLHLFGLHTFAEFDDPKNVPQFEDASAITHLTQDAPPIAMFYSEPDAPLPPDSKPGEGIHSPIFGHKLKAALDALGIENLYRHADDGLQPTGIAAVQQFLRDHLLDKATP